VTRNRQPGGSRAAFIFIFITVALDMMAVGIIAPVLPKLIIEFQGGDVASAAWYVGLFATIWAAMQFLFLPLIGAASDRFGRRPVILLSNLGLGLDYLLMAMAPTLGWLFIGRLVSGITSASYPTAGAYIADVTSPGERAGRFGMLGAAFGLGFIVGPAVGGLLGGIDLRLPFWVPVVSLRWRFGFMLDSALDQSMHTILSSNPRANRVFQQVRQVIRFLLHSLVQDLHGLHVQPQADDQQALHVVHPALEHLGEVFAAR
jgi:MFS family permease